MGPWPRRRRGDDGSSGARAADTAGAVAAFVDGLAARNCEYSIGTRVNDALDAAIVAVRPDAWAPAVDANGRERRGAQVRWPSSRSPWPDGRTALGPSAGGRSPIPARSYGCGTHNGLRHQVVLTNSVGDAADLELRHRRHAEVGNRIKNLKDCGLERMPFTSFEANAAWMELTLCAADLVAWCQSICLDGELARPEPRTLRYRLLHAGGRVVHTAGVVLLRLPDHWPWTPELATAYRRLVAFTA